MNKKITLIALLLSFTAFSQNRFDQYSLEAGYGLSLVGKPSMVGYTHADIAFRYMADEYWGLKFEYGYDAFRTNETPKKGSTYNRFSVQGVHNLGRTLNFRNLTDDTVGLLVHGGLGYSSLKSETKVAVDNIGHVIIGVTPQIQISDNLALHFDTSLVMNFTQHYNFEGEQPKPGVIDSFTSNLVNVSIGLTYYFGRNGSSPDWR